MNTIIRRSSVTLSICLTFYVAAAARSSATEPVGVAAKSPSTPFVAPASDEAEMAVLQFRLPKGFKASLFAAEPQLANPVAFYIDEHSRFYVVETFRRKSAVIDVRNVMHWLDDDVASRTIASRIAMLKKFQDPPTLAAMSKDSERIRVIEDRDNDGKADFDRVFSDHHNRLEDGIAAGVLVRDGDVYFANVPSLWRLRDTNNDGAEDVREELHYGYGVRYAFNGHDLHGLRFGPDGKLYFSMGDRGLHVEKTPDGRVVSNPDSGAVLRCNPDGTELELFHTGLRNPQELAFDDFGNLFTGDNNSDAGDAARWVYVVEGGDTGWRIGYQTHDFPVSRGPWNHEGLWRVKPEFPAAYIIPPVVELKASGPSGLTRDPGTGLPEELRGRFFLADFRGSPTNSFIHAIKLAPKGAGFEVVEQERIIGNLLCTDVEFGWDGMYVSDWTDGWLTTGKGRIYRFWHEEAIKDKLVAETRKLMGEGMGKRASRELGRLLTHPDQRVRQAAQFELAARGEKFVELLSAIAGARGGHRMARIHAIWGLGQIGQRLGVTLVPFLSDHDEEVRAQAVKILGERRVAEAGPGIARAMKDPSPRVRYFAALGFGKVKPPGEAEALINFVRDNAGADDPYLRHAGVMALANLNDADVLDSVSRDSAPAVRMAALLAYRRLGDPKVARFLGDPEAQLVLEAARAINDVPIDAANSQLAELVTRENLSEPVISRVLNANYRLGTAESAAALAGYAKSSNDSARYRVEALDMLGAWEKPPGRDRVTGNWRPLPPRDAKLARDAAAPVLPEILRTAPDAVRVAAAELVTKLGVADAVLLAELVGDTKLATGIRVAALGALADVADAARLQPVVDAAMKDPDERLRAAGVRAMTKLPGAVERLSTILKSGSIRERQAAVATLGTIDGEAADEEIIDLLDSMVAGGTGPTPVPPEIRLDVLEAAAARKSPDVRAGLDAYNAKLDASDPLAAYRETLHGGDASLGEHIFRERADVSCIRCHSVRKKGGNAGPDLIGVGLRLSREQLLESIVTPGKVIAPGYESVAVRLRDGTMYAGILKKEDEKTLHLIDPGKSDVRVDKSQVKNRRGGMSSMPDNIKDTLSKQDVRNLVEFLAGLKEEVPPKKPRKKEGGDDPDDDGT